MGSGGSFDYEKKKTEVTGEFDKSGQKSNHSKLCFGICPLLRAIGFKLEMPHNSQGPGQGLLKSCWLRHAFLRNISSLVIPFQSTEIVSPVVT